MLRHGASLHFPKGEITERRPSSAVVPAVWVEAVRLRKPAHVSMNLQNGYPNLRSLTYRQVTHHRVTDRIAAQAPQWRIEPNRLLYDCVEECEARIILRHHFVSVRDVRNFCCSLLLKIMMLCQ